MSIKGELSVELKDAMRAHDRNRLDVVRQINTEIARAVSAPRFTGEPDDELYRKTIAAYSKKMGKALADYESYGIGVPRRRPSCGSRSSISGDGCRRLRQRRRSRHLSTRRCRRSVRPT